MKMANPGDQAARPVIWSREVWQRNGTTAVVVSPSEPVRGCDHLPAIRDMIGKSLPLHGAVLLRGLEKGSVSDFTRFLASFGHEPLSYEFASTPRSHIGQGVYSSTEYPHHQWIPQHNEQSYTSSWPLKIWFYCAVPPDQGGETPIANSREVYRRLDPAIRARFSRHGLMYVRNYGNGLDVPWQKVFQTSDKDVVEAYCRAHRIAWEWREEGELRTRHLCQSEAQHPMTGESVWFNQAHLFHISGLESGVREALLDAVDEADLPRNVYYGDGSRIEEAILDEIRGVYDEVMLSFPWQDGDILLLDNMLSSHGRAPFGGRRRILVAMTEPCTSLGRSAAAVVAVRQETQSRNGRV
jgi:alpha-ketoglutarate-dependent taurine dioxygenase